MPYIVIVGSPARGFQFRGPFNSKDAAEAYAVDCAFGWAAPLLPPEHPTRKSRIVTAKRPGRRHGDTR
jgi:hypothetical protein